MLGADAFRCTAQASLAAAVFAHAPAGWVVAVGHAGPGQLAHDLRAYGIGVIGYPVGGPLAPRSARSRCSA